ncbi:KEOPS complex subunit Pcc1 [Sulfuracidifex tepidarius]|uniref:KEOPS complex subunit n=1 Tax=Sulfuracidifex tepidarius TaxID=1294262 RepID=A0A510E4M1_9CREN|nr:KEOPS complex subunit Pcc1 [Sulfuracidifex tepidarius]BBG24241.1 hypothetical protein IC006_1550 [Sulfuracidifex tepidarius]BBG26998.1 hypothetical protein IC007_1527 [Sulfuracidifex tepidarius]
MVSIKIEVDYDKPEEIVRSIEVDNVDVPEGMRISSKEDANKAIIMIEMDVKEPKELMTMRNTADEIMRHVDVVVRTMRGLNI